MERVGEGSALDAERQGQDMQISSDDRTRLHRCLFASLGLLAACLVAASPLYASPEDELAPAVTPCPPPCAIPCPECDDLYTCECRKPPKPKCPVV
jgi:hypothetical protein